MSRTNLGVKGLWARNKKKPVSKGRSTRSKKVPAGQQSGKHLKNAGVVKRARRYKPGTVALREIRRLQKTTELLLKRAPFTRLVRELAMDKGQNRNIELRWKSDALAAIQEAAEAFLITHFEMLLQCAFHSKRVTINEKDNQFLLRLLSIAAGSIGGYYVGGGGR
ncbi:histone H3.1 [Ciborinia camelliae]|nr:histone H3.1 [Ciborinia camelliae]